MWNTPVESVGMVRKPMAKVMFSSGRWSQASFAPLWGCSISHRVPCISSMARWRTRVKWFF